MHIVCANVCMFAIDGITHKHYYVWMAKKATGMKTGYKAT